MASNYVQIDVITDDYGDSVAITVIGAYVSLTPVDGGSPPVHLNAAQRDQFAKAYAEAERRAEAAGREVPGD